MRPLLRRGFVLLCLCSVTLLAQTSPSSLKVLFLGNSLTAGNDVPALVQAMAQLQGVQVNYNALAPGGYALEDHWHDGHQALLEAGDYDVLILQQGPSTLADSQANLREWSIVWANAARQYGTQPALYMIWPVRTQTNGFFLVSQSYQNAAFAAGTAIFPAGEAWQQVIRANPGITLYSGDDLHAAPAGSFLAAMVIARGLVSLDPARVPATVNGITVSSAALAAFRTVVAGLPATSLGGLAGTAPVTPETDPTTPTPPAANPPATPVTPAPASPAATPTTTARKGGGGAPSFWFLLVLLGVSAARMLRPIRPN